MKVKVRAEGTSAHKRPPSHSYLTHQPACTCCIPPGICSITEWSSILKSVFIVIVNMMRKTLKHNFSFCVAFKMGYCVMRIQAWPDGHHLFGDFQPSFICVFVWMASTAAKKPSKQRQQQNTCLEPNWTRRCKTRLVCVVDQNRVTPSFGPIVISFSDSLPPLSSEMWNIPCERKMRSTKVKPMLEKSIAQLQVAQVPSARTTLCQLPGSCLPLPAVLQAAGEQYYLRHTYFLQ